MSYNIVYWLCCACHQFLSTTRHDNAMKRQAMCDMLYMLFITAPLIYIPKNMTSPFNMSLQLCVSSDYCGIFSYRYFTQDIRPVDANQF